MKTVTRALSAEFYRWSSLAQVLFIAVILLVTGCAGETMRAELAPPPPFLRAPEIHALLQPGVESIEPAAGDTLSPPRLFLKKCLRSEGLERSGPLDWRWGNKNIGIGFSSSALHKTDSPEAILYFSTGLFPDMAPDCR